MTFEVRTRESDVESTTWRLTSRLKYDVAEALGSYLMAEALGSYLMAEALRSYLMAEALRSYLKHDVAFVSECLRPS